MAILVLTSCAGSPGATTLAVGLALTWPRSVLVVDADPGAHQSILAGFLTGHSAQGKGLLRVAEAHRDRRPLEEVVLDQAVPLTETDEPRRLLLPGFTRPGSASLFGAVWPDLAETLTDLGSAGIDVIIDLGRMSSAGIPGALREHADLTALVMRSHLRSVMSARVHLPLLADSERNSAASNVGLIVVGPHKPYAPGEIAAALGLPVVCSMPLDPLAAAHLSDGAARPRRFETSELVRGLHEATDVIDDRLGMAEHRSAVAR